MTIECRNLEVHVSHACNLACESCAHYSNDGHRGSLDPATARDWFANWSHRLSPGQFSLLGGEPAINPRLTDFVWLAADAWPAAQRILVTNGFLLSRHSRLPVALRSTETVLHISIHHDGDEYQRRLQPVRELINDWQRRWNIRVEWRPSHGTWTRRYQGDPATIEPFADGKPHESWSNCPARNCLQLHDGKLWKCPAIAYLQMQNERRKLGTAWSPYLAYEPLPPTCDDDRLRRFVNRDAEGCCGMCPAKPERFDLPSPLPGVTQ